MINNIPIIVITIISIISVLFYCLYKYKYYTNLYKDVFLEFILISGIKNFKCDLDGSFTVYNDIPYLDIDTIKELINKPLSHYLKVYEKYYSISKKTNKQEYEERINLIINYYAILLKKEYDYNKILNGWSPKKKQEDNK